MSAAMRGAENRTLHLVTLWLGEPACGERADQLAAAHHRAHGRRGPKRDSHDSYIKAAFGTDFEAMKAEIADHMRRGMETTEKFLRSMPDLSGKPKRGVTS